MKNVLITGATGFIGSFVADHYNAMGWNVYYSGFRHQNQIPGTLVCGEFAEIPWSQLPKTNLLIHLAAITNPQEKDEKRVMRVNYWDSINLVRQAIQQEIPRIIYASSAAVYGNSHCPDSGWRENARKCPLAAYGMSKLLLDKEMMELTGKTKTIIVGLRFSNVCASSREQHKGDLASMVYRLALQMADGNPEVFADGSQSRDWVDVRDVVQAVSLAAKAPLPGIYNVGSGKATSFNEVFEMLSEYLPGRQLEYIDNPYSETYQSFTRLDITKAIRQLEYLPEYCLEETIDDMLNGRI